MKSIEEVKKIINWDECEYIKKSLNESQINQFLNIVRTKRDTTIRINTIKISKLDGLAKLNKKKIKVSNFQLIDNAFIVKDLDDRSLLKLDEVQKGEIYLQSLSSQLPPVILDPKPGEYIVDMAASPGSKTSQMASLMKNLGSIDAVELDFIRKERLDHNLNLLGVKNTTTFLDKGENFLKDVYDKYDKVLLDAPCSGEGRFSIYDKATYGGYSAKLVEKLSKTQIKLLDKALQSVKPGGVVLYSTCTLNYLENEYVVTEATKKYNCKIEKLDNKFYEINEYISAYTKFENMSFRKDIVNSLKYLPSNRMEGFFIAKIVKI